MTAFLPRLLLPLAAVLALAACTPQSAQQPPHASANAMPEPLRVATWNVSLYSEEAGGLIRRLEAGDDSARQVAAILQRMRPDIVLLNEFDYDPQGLAADIFQRDYLQHEQVDGGPALHYPYRYFAPVNTGVASGLDLDGNGEIGSEGRAYGDDAWGYGLHPGQYGMLLLSKHPVDAAAARTFQHLKWSALPGAQRPHDPDTGVPFHPDAVWKQLRLSSKSHWDVPVHTPLGTVHILAAHPTPPAFDGPERRNVARNADEIRLLRDYISGGETPWLCDDAGHCGPLADDARFVILGDLNNDPTDGSGSSQAIIELLEHPRVLRHPTPTSSGGEPAALATGAANLTHLGAHAHDTGAFSPRTGNLRVDYVLPSTGFGYLDGGVYWPAPDEDGADLAEASDHRLVWVDLE